MQGPTGLRLLISGVPPFVLDVDSGRVTPARRLPPARGSARWVVGVGGRAGLVLTQAGREVRVASVRAERVVGLGTGTDVAPAGDGRSVWVAGGVRASRCTLRRVGLDGRVLRAPRRFPCGPIGEPAGGSLGLVVNRRRVLDPLTGRAVLEPRRRIVAVAGAKLVLAGPGDGLTLLDAATRARRRLRWPSIVGELDTPAVDPRGRFVALAFANPAWNLGPLQVLDVWLLDTRPGGLTQLPGMPAFVALKRTSMAWTREGRLVLVAESGGRDIVAVWRPGERRLAVKVVRVPNRGGGGDSFAVLR